ncbi:L,D-transpeptidase family protein, partial [Geodermatophilus amargosae]|uniref:L,D-transpeptidase family protein n=1 Tax=Geodermatophilus amargosae TaxID=1296565 RepID=UPI0034DFD836
MALAGLALVPVSRPTPAHATPPPAGTQQLVTVETSSPGATTGVLRAWERGAGGWRLVLGPIPAWVGSNGVGAAREGRATTPAGTFPLTEAFGRQADPGTDMPYFQSDTSDWWDGNSASPTYNSHVRRATSPGGASENLYRAGAVYDYAVNIGYNLDRVPDAGSAIFLHVANGAPTAGCVAIERGALQTLLRWLRPDARPHVMINVAPVRMAIADAWYRDGGQASALGLPAGPERPVGDGVGAFQEFERGAVYWSPSTGAHSVVAGIFQSWNAQGRQRGALGYPVSDEAGTASGGSHNWFQRGAVYWSPRTGAHWMVAGIL